MILKAAVILIKAAPLVTGREDSQSSSNSVLVEVVEVLNSKLVADSSSLEASLFKPLHEIGDSWAKSSSSTVTQHWLLVPSQGRRRTIVQPTQGPYQHGDVTSARLETIIQALTATLNPRIPNAIRQQALEHLEHIKQQSDAPQNGFALADDWSQDSAIRYYGLQLLEYSVKYKWNEYSSGQQDQLKRWTQCLAGGIRDQDVGMGEQGGSASYIGRKIGQLWVEVAKRCWGDDQWMDMDHQLVNLWEKPWHEKGAAGKIMCMYILETLNEDIINLEDAVAGLRIDVLGHALNEIMVPAGMYTEMEHLRGDREGLRAGEEGWLARLCGFFSECIKQFRVGGGQDVQRAMRTCALKALHALRPTMAWISLKAVVEVGSVDALFLPFHTEDAEMQIAATEVLYGLLARPHSAQYRESWVLLNQQTLRADRVLLISHAFKNATFAPGEDEANHTLQKKLSEVLSLLADAITHCPRLATKDDLHDTLDLPAFFDLLLTVLQQKSLIVSIPVLHSWSKLMSVEDGTIIDLVLQALGVLIQTCSDRLIRYENVPEDTNDEIVEFLKEDFDTIPERHAFLGNYRRYCVTIIQAIARSRPMEALQHVLEQMQRMLLEGPYTFANGLRSATDTEHIVAVLRFDAQFNVVASALKGFSLWCGDIASLTPEEPLHAKAQVDRENAYDSLQNWSGAVVDIGVDDPEVAGQVITTLVTILKTVKPRENFVLQIVQHLITMRLSDNGAHTAHSEAIKTFEGLRTVELQKLAVTFSNELLAVYQDLEPRVDDLVQTHSTDARLVWGYKAFLFMIIHRSTDLAQEPRTMRLQQMLKPIYESWQDKTLLSAVTDFHSFCRYLGLADIADFYIRYRFDRTQDWTAQQLDQDGQARQTEIKDKTDGLPLRMTKSMGIATTEKLRPGSQEYNTACALWSNLLPVILPTLLQMLRHAQAFHNMSNWSDLPSEIQNVVKRTLQDRFWQSGISSESKDEFYARIHGSKTSYEGFASAVRGSMRFIREQGYHIIYLMTKFDEQFYGIADLAQPLAEALFADADALPANHLHPIINLTTGLVQRCPPHHRAQFLPPLLKGLFTKLDLKISREWNIIDQAMQRSTDGDELSDEMRVESVLRQLTYSMVSFIPFFLDHDKPPPPRSQANSNGHSTPRSLSDIMLQDETVLEPMILFCTHALRMRDIRCCQTICRVFRCIIPLFASTSDYAAPSVREFMCTEVLKACITSLNEPYFADMQKDLAALIAHIIVAYSRESQTPRNVLSSLPSISESKLNRALTKLAKPQSERTQRSLVLELLDGVRGVSIYEAGKIVRTAPMPPAFGGKRSGPGAKAAAKYMEVEQQVPAVVQDGEMGLEGLAGLFGDS
nr:protein msn5 [Quercus suber]